MKTSLSLHLVGHFGTFFDDRANEPGVCIPAIVGHFPSDTMVIFLDSRLALELVRYFSPALVHGFLVETILLGLWVPEDR